MINNVNLVYHPDENIPFIISSNKVKQYGCEILFRTDKAFANEYDLINGNILMDRNCIYYEIKRKEDYYNDEFYIEKIAENVLNDTYRTISGCLLLEVRKREVQDLIDKFKSIIDNTIFEIEVEKRDIQDLIDKYKLIVNNTIFEEGGNENDDSKTD